MESKRSLGPPTETGSRKSLHWTPKETRSLSLSSAPDTVFPLLYITVVYNVLYATISMHWIPFHFLNIGRPYIFQFGYLWNSDRITTVQNGEAEYQRANTDRLLRGLGLVTGWMWWYPESDTGTVGWARPGSWPKPVWPSTSALVLAEWP